MSSSEALSYAYLESHPADAARVLEKLVPESASALLQSAPLRLATPVLRQMLPISAARCLEHLDDTKIVGLLHGIGAQSGVALLRYFGDERRAGLLAQLPTTLTITFELLLNYSEDTVGAWMDPRVLALPADMTVGESLDRVRNSEESLVIDPYVIDRNQCLIGYVELADLLRADAKTKLSKLVRPSSHRLPSQSSLNGLHEHSGWREVSKLPVVEHGDRLVGVLTHATLQRALSIGQNKPMTNRTEDTFASVASAYWFGVSALMQALVSLLPVEHREEGDL